MTRAGEMPSTMLHDVNKPRRNFVSAEAPRKPPVSGRRHADIARKQSSSEEESLSSRQNQRWSKSGSSKYLEDKATSFLQNKPTMSNQQQARQAGRDRGRGGGRGRGVIAAGEIFILVKWIIKQLGTKI